MLINYHQIAQALPHYYLRRLHNTNLIASDKELFTQIVITIMEMYENGHTICEIKKSDIEFLLRNKLAIDFAQALNGERAFIVIKDNYATLYNIWNMENNIAQHIKKRCLQKNNINIDIGDNIKDLDICQQQAIKCCLQFAITIINGGPGSGKTFTIAKLVQIISKLQPQARIAFAAPTGKAAKRMDESLQQQMAIDIEIANAQTLHRLLQINNNGKRINQYLIEEWDYLIVDEASMLSLNLANILFNSLSLQTNLILLGDAQQLSAVEPGAILQDLIKANLLTKQIVTLTKSHRFTETSAIGNLTRAINNGEITTFKNCFNEYKDEIKYDILDPLKKNNLYQFLIAQFQSFHQLLNNDFDQNNIERILLNFDLLRILCSANQGDFGSVAINAQITKYFHDKSLNYNYNYHPIFYHGLPIMILKNDYKLGLFNGDIGLCLCDKENNYFVYFANKKSPIAAEHLNPNNYSAAYSMSIHKSQGSEFEKVIIVIDKEHQKILSKELLYTAVSRAKKYLHLFACDETIKNCISNHNQKQTGLVNHLML